VGQALAGESVSTEVEHIVEAVTRQSVNTRPNENV
jgi:hypothetical protein